jgi:1-acyl-sn-glycerol-3-phosphate acyltransferase
MNEATPFYRFAQWLASHAWRLYASLDVRGTEHVPHTGPFLLICNHQSNLDPILIQSVAPRPVHAMAKSTQFAVPVFGRIMRYLWSFPVRRHQVDPLAVRLSLRYLREGYGVCIYVEGERSWDGRLQKPRRGTLRLALKAGVPVIPCVITGSYEAWPRWDRRIRRHHVRITFGPPIPLPHLDRRADREPFLDEAAARIMAALRRMIDEPVDQPARRRRKRRRGRDTQPG